MDLTVHRKAIKFNHSLTLPLQAITSTEEYALLLPFYAFISNNIHLRICLFITLLCIYKQ